MRARVWAERDRRVHGPRAFGLPQVRKKLEKWQQQPPTGASGDDSGSSRRSARVGGSVRMDTASLDLSRRRRGSTATATTAAAEAVRESVADDNSGGDLDMLRMLARLRLRRGSSSVFDTFVEGRPANELTSPPLPVKRTLSTPQRRIGVEEEHESF